MHLRLYSKENFQLLRVVCTNVHQNLIADQRHFKAKYLQKVEENWTKK